MATIHVDGKQYEVDGADNLLQACLSLGLDIPYFCWHPALGSVGACRQCAVKQYKDENDKQGRIVMSCMTPAANGTYISIGDDEAKQFREAIVEFLMTNHPHDCPVCEEGGHCHLQDMTVMTGHHSRHYSYQKRTHNNQDLGPFIGHEMNRCISCYRCVRYYKDYAGGSDLGVFGAAANVYFGRAEDGPLESEFSGNLTEVCPTGVFTDKTHSERYTRKWDMQFAPSICAGCAVGCNVSPGERYGEIRRVENRYNGEVNGYFLCDRGRFGYGYVNRKDRPRRALLRHDGRQIAIEAGEAIAQASSMLKRAKKVLGIGSPRASLESNFALRELVGAENFYSGMSTTEHALVARAVDILRNGAVKAASLASMEQADAVLVLGEDVTSTAPRVALALRQAARGKMQELGAKKSVPDWQVIALADLVQKERNPVFVVAPETTRLDDIALATLQAQPQDIARLGFAIAQLLDAKAPVAGDLPEPMQALAGRIAGILRQAKRPLIVSGTGALSVAVMDAAMNIAQALKAAGAAVEIALAVPEVNSVGVSMMQAGSMDTALARIDSGEVDTLVVLENDLFRRVPQARAERAIKGLKSLLVVDHQMTPTAERAQIVLPAASVFEGDGSFVSMEGRAQRHFQVFDPVYYNKDIGTVEAWRWLAQLKNEPWKVVDDVTAACAGALPDLAKITEAAPSAKFRVNGMKLAREPHRYSGRTAMRANISVHEPRQPQDADTALNFSMEGYNGIGRPDRPAALMPYAWAPGWNSPSAWNKFQAEIGGHLRGGDAGVRVFESGTGAIRYAAVGASQPVAEGLRALPLRRHFGEEELSARAQPIVARMAPACAVLNPKDAARLGVNGTVRVTVEGETFELPAQASATFPEGAIGLPAGHAAVPPLTADSVAVIGKGD
ncbi:MAG: NADH-quinone oxidoreductase subunit NuoG [Nevskiaceae bacterium]|nr:MAG: NADH-quinone oxidoreductase subunit NuoG [Nevskiaceae bacterium]